MGECGPRLVEQTAFARQDTLQVFALLGLVGIHVGELVDDTARCACDDEGIHGVMPVVDALLGKALAQCKRHIGLEVAFPVLVHPLSEEVGACQIV